MADNKKTLITLDELIQKFREAPPPSEGQLKASALALLNKLPQDGSLGLGDIRIFTLFAVSYGNNKPEQLNFTDPVSEA